MNSRAVSYTSVDFVESRSSINAALETGQDVSNSTIIDTEFEMRPRNYKKKERNNRNICYLMLTLSVIIIALAVALIVMAVNL